MTQTTQLEESKKISAAYVMNLIGVIAGSIISVAALTIMSPIGFFGGLAGTLFCLDGIR